MTLYNRQILFKLNLLFNFVVFGLFPFSFDTKQVTLW